MLMKRRDILDLNYVLGHTEFEQPITTKFRYAASKNIKITGEEVDLTQDAFKATESILEYSKKESELYQKHGISSYEEIERLPSEQREVVIEELSIFRSENKDVLEEIARFEAEREAFLDEEVEINLHMVSLDDFPEISKNNHINHWVIWNRLEVLIIPPDEE